MNEDYLLVCVSVIFPFTNIFVPLGCAFHIPRIIYDLQLSFLDINLPKEQHASASIC